MGALASRLETDSVCGRQSAETRYSVIEYAVIKEDGVFVTDCPMLPEILLAHEDIDVINERMPAAIREVIKIKSKVKTEVRVSRAIRSRGFVSPNVFHCQVVYVSPKDSVG